MTQPISPLDTDEAQAPALADHPAFLPDLLERDRGELLRREAEEAALFGLLVDSAYGIQVLTLERGFLYCLGSEGGCYYVGGMLVAKLEGRDASGLCVHPAKKTSPIEQMLSVKLLVESNERRFLRIANRYQLPPAERKFVIAELRLLLGFGRAIRRPGASERIVAALYTCQLDPRS